MVTPGHLTCLLKNQYVGQEATVRTGYGTTDWAVHCHPVYLTSMQSTSPGCMSQDCQEKYQQLQIWRRAWQPTPAFLPGESSWTEEPGRPQFMGLQRVRHAWVTKRTQVCRWSRANGRKWGGTKEPLDEGGREEWKSWLETALKKSKITASSPIISWQIEGKKVETVTDCNFLGSKTPSDGDCSHEIKRSLLLGRKVMTNLASILKSKDVTLPMKVCMFKDMVFPVVM